MSATKVSIGSLIRQAVEAVGEVEPAALADEVLSRIDDADLRGYLHDLIIARLSSETGRMRAQVTPARASLSTKQSLIRDQYWPAFLNQFISLPTGYKRLAEATAEDLRFIADMRRSQAHDLFAKAEQFGALADLMDKAQVKFLEQLDQSVAKKVLRAA